MRLYTKLLLALLAGVLAGGLSQWIEADWLRKGLILLEPFGFAFIRLISMVVVPLVVSSLFVATSSFGDTRRLAGVGGKTLAYFLVTTLIACSSVWCWHWRSNRVPTWTPVSETLWRLNSKKPPPELRRRSSRGRASFKLSWK